MRINRVFLWSFVAFVFLTWAAIALYPNLRPPDHLGVGLLLGSLFGHSLLASAWVVLGPGGWVRWPLAVLWCFTIPVAWLINSSLYSLQSDMGIVWVSGFSVVMFVQVVLWPLRLGLRVRICDSKAALDFEPAVKFGSQFGIQHLMLVTAVVAAIIAVGRLSLPYVQQWISNTHEAPIFAFLIVVTCVLCLPLAFSILAMPKPLLPTVAVIVLTILATFCELPLIKTIGIAGRGPDWLHFVLINFFTISPVLMATLALRSSGYQLERSRRNQENANSA